MRSQYKQLFRLDELRYETLQTQSDSEGIWQICSFSEHDEVTIVIKGNCTSLSAILLCCWIVYLAKPDLRKWHQQSGNTSKVMNRINANGSINSVSWQQSVSFLLFVNAPSPSPPPPHRPIIHSTKPNNASRDKTER
ncbi:uncharacterized protein LOC143360780 [Halictus rubicundus]|uniref:uncharacterized protein LOC143360780 n=1 Tax=Halictus rubicundus TaxID=77578 RepID=UPI00403610F8